MDSEAEFNLLNEVVDSSSSDDDDELYIAAADIVLIQLNTTQTKLKVVMKCRTGHR